MNESSNYDIIKVSQAIANYMVLYSHKEHTTKFVNNFNIKEENVLRFGEEILFFIMFCTEYTFWKIQNNPFSDNDVLNIMSSTMVPVAQLHYILLDDSYKHSDSKVIEKLMLKDNSKIRKMHDDLRERFLKRRENYSEHDPMESDAKALYFSFTLSTNLRLAGGIDYNNEDFLKAISGITTPILDEISEYLMSTIFPMYKI